MNVTDELGEIYELLAEASRRMGNLFCTGPLPVKVCAVGVKLFTLVEDADDLISTETARLLDTSDQVTV